MFSLTAYNQTASPLSYLSGAVVIPASSSLTVDSQYFYSLYTDGQFRLDISKDIVRLSDGAFTYNTTDALDYLDRIAGLRDKDGNGITSTEVITDATTHRAIDVNVVQGATDATPDKTVFTFGDSVFNPVGGVRSDAGDTLPDGSTGAARITPERALHINLRNNDGTEIGTQTDPVAASMGFDLDTGNTIDLTLADASPGSPWEGDWFPIWSLRYVRNLVVMASNVTSGLGGTFTFQYSLDGVNPTVNETRTIDDFSAVRDFNLLAVGAYFRILFEPSRTLVGGEIVFITTIHYRQDAGPFVRLANQQIEEANAAMAQTFAYLKAFDPTTGKSVNLRPTTDESLRVADQTAYKTPSGSRFTESIRDDISHAFTKERVATEILKLVDLGSVGGTVTADATNGQAVFSTGAAAGNTCIFRSEKQLIYETAHGMRGEMSIELAALPTGNAKVEWGAVTDDLQNGSGYGVDATGVYVWRRKNSTSSYASKVYQTSWNRDKCDGAVSSLFKFTGTPQALNAIKDNLYIVEFEWLGADGHTYRIKSPTTDILTTHIEEYTNQNTGSSVPTPKMGLHIRITNDTSGGGDVVVRTGSWRGGIYTSKVSATGKNPNEDYTDIRVQGIHDNNSSTTPLDASAVYRGKWFKWVDAYVKIAVSLASDVAGTLYVDMSDLDSPVDGDDSGITDSQATAFNPAVEPTLRINKPIKSKWVRARYINGAAAQAQMLLVTGFLTADAGVPQQPLLHLPTPTQQAGIMRVVPAVQNAAGTAYVEWPVGPNGGPKTYVNHIEDDVLIEPLSSGAASQVVVGTAATRLDPSPISDRRVINVTNDGPGRMAVGHSNTITFSANSIVLKVGASRTFGLDAGVQLWGIAEDTGGVQTTLTRSGGSAAGTATSPSNALTSNNVYATMTSGQTVDISGFTAGTTNPLVSVKLGIEANKQTGQTETVAFQEVATGTSTTGTVTTSTSLTGTANHLYLAAISRETGSITVTTVSGLGLTWSRTATQVSDDGNRAVDVWQAQGTPSGSGTVTASFSSTPSRSHISVSRYSNVSTTTPIQATVSANGTSTTPSAGGLSGTNKGMSFMAAVIDNASSFTPGAGYTTVSAEFNTDSLGVLRKALTSTGTDTPTATINASKHWAAISLTMTPADAVNPIITLSYTLSGSPGATTGTATLTSGTDATTKVDVTSDRAWVVADVPNVHVIATGTTLSAAAANIDHVFLELVDTTGNTTRTSIWEGGKAVS